MSRRFVPTLVSLLSLLAGCGAGSSGDTELRTPQPPQLPGVYAGHFPCSNCAAIAATLWLRPDGGFVLRQTFLDDDGAADGASSYALGRWRWDESAAEAVLEGAGPQRRLAALDDGRLQLRTPSPLEHVLSRDPGSPAFTDRVRIDGESSVVNQGAFFTECLTGLQWAIVDDRGLRELRRQHRLLNSRGKIARTTVEGHLVSGAAGEMLAVDRFVTLRPGTGC